MKKLIFIMIVGWLFIGCAPSFSEFQGADVVGKRNIEVTPYVSETFGKNEPYWKENRNMDDVQKSLTALKERAAGDGNLIPYIIGSVQAQATLGEISDTFREVFGEY